ncbi:DUF4282 domain-containing protein [Kaistia defluvii]|uniref:DUF4282 domain-containing protein n=1 Tax=Kaistia defluvii TaxID=410841 RepID=A0ABV2QYI8_9HYPH
MTSFFDLFKWDRFVATSVIELLFWLLAAIAVLFGISGLLNGLALVQLAPVNALLAIAFSIIGTLAAIVAARVACEAVIMLFRVNENLMDIRDNIAAPPERAPFVAAPVPVVEDPFVMAFEEMLPAPPEPVTAPVATRAEGRWSETRAPAARTSETARVPEPRLEGKSSETSSLEARLAEIRARRDGVAAAAARAAATTAAPAVTDAGLAGARLHLEEAAAPKWEAPPVISARRDEAKPEPVKAAAVEVKPPGVETKPAIATAPIAEAKPVEPKAPEVKPAEVKASDPKAVETKAPDVQAPAAKAAEAVASEVKAPEVKAPEPKRGESKKADSKKTAKLADAAVMKAVEEALVEVVQEAPQDTPKDAATEAADRLVEEATKALVDAAEATIVAAEPEKQKTNDAA